MKHQWQSNEPSRHFIGKIIVFGGDFRQVFPVVPRGTKAKTINASLVSSYLWPKMEMLRLSTNMGAHSDSIFSDLLLCAENSDDHNK